MVILKNCILFLSDLIDQSDLLIVKNPNVRILHEIYLSLLGQVILIMRNSRRKQTIPWEMKQQEEVTPTERRRCSQMSWTRATSNWYFHQVGTFEGHVVLMELNINLYYSMCRLTSLKFIKTGERYVMFMVCLDHPTVAIFKAFRS